MPFCKKCGAMLHDGASFCMACGAKYEEPRGRYYEEPDTSDEEENLNSAPVTQVNNEQPHIVGITEPETKLIDNTPNTVVQNDAVQQEPQITEPVQPSIENKEPAQPSYYEPPTVQPSIENKEPAQPSYYEPPTVQPIIENKEPAQPSFYEPPTVQPSIENKEPVQPSYYEPPTVQPIIENKEPVQPSFYEPPTVQQSIENKEPAQPSFYEPPTVQQSIENKEPAQPSFYEPPTVQPSIENKEPARPSFYEPPTAQPNNDQPQTAQQQEPSRPKFLDDQSIDTKQPVQYKNPFAISDQQNTTAKEVPKWMLNQHPILPIKNHSHSGKKIAIFAACLIILLGGCAVAAKLFFARDLLQMCMGQANYMKSIEQGAVTSLTDTTVDDLNMVLQLIPTSGIDKALDYEGSVNFSLDDSLKNKVGDSTKLDKLLNYINSIKIKGSSNQNNNQVQASFAISDKSANLISANVFMDKNGKCIFQLPDISQTYFVANTGSKLKNTLFDFKCDPDKLKTSLHSIMQPYVDAVSSAKVTVLNDQTVLVGGVTVKAQKISATFTSEQLNQIVKKMLETAKNDEYFYTFISNNYNTFSQSSNSKADKLSKSQYQSMIDSAIAELKSGGSSETLTVSAYVDRDNSQVARTYEIQSAKEKSSFSFINSNQYGKKQTAISIILDNKNVLSATAVYSNSDSGTVQLLLAGNNSESCSLEIEFSGVKKAKFMDHDVMLGTYKLSLSGLNDVLNKKASSANNNQQVNMKDSKITLSCDLKNNKLETKFGVEIPKFATMSFTVSAAPKTSSAITIPTVNDSNSIDAYANNTSSTVSKKMQKFSKDFDNYYETLGTRDKELKDLLNMAGVDIGQINKQYPFV